jgi:bacteriorhodopsin
MSAMVYFVCAAHLLVHWVALFVVWIAGAEGGGVVAVTSNHVLRSPRA